MINHPQQLFIQTKRLLIRPPMGDDFEAWRSGHRQNPGSTNPFDTSPKGEINLSLEQYNKLLARIDDARDRDEEYTMWAFERDSGKWIGSASLFDILRGSQQNAWIGGYLLNAFWSKGYAHEAARAIIQQGFQRLGLHRIEALTDPSNATAQRVLEKLSFRYEGRSSKRILNRGAWRDADVYALTSEEYFSR